MKHPSKESKEYYKAKAKVAKPKLEHGSSEHRDICFKAVDLEADIKKVRKRLEELEAIHNSLMQPIYEMQNYERYKKHLWNHWMEIDEDERMGRAINPILSFRNFLELYPKEAEEHHPERFNHKDYRHYS